ncbi:hypothetical protein HanIR_Chr10g0488601 [Helianthus annuus]|nr:hypothetical protein HanIR_Chr10g0488601 [Helianthus annuus]
MIDNGVECNGGGWFGPFWHSLGLGLAWFRENFGCSGLAGSKFGSVSSTGQSFRFSQQLVSGQIWCDSRFGFGKSEPNPVFFRDTHCFDVVGFGGFGADRCWTPATKQRRHQKPRSSHRSVEFISAYFEFM